MSGRVRMVPFMFSWTPLTLLTLLTLLTRSRGVGFALVLVVALFAGQSACDDTDVYQEELAQTLRAQLEGIGGVAHFTLPQTPNPCDVLDTPDLDPAVAWAQIPQSPANPISASKVILGQQLFFEPSLAVYPNADEGRYTYTCATCHAPDHGFAAGTRQAIGEGGVGQGQDRSPDPSYDVLDMDVQPWRASLLVNSAYQTTLGWNGAWTDSPGLGTVESKVIDELAAHGMSVDGGGGGGGGLVSLCDEQDYQRLFVAAFGADGCNDSNAGLAIAAWLRVLTTHDSPFQRLLRGDDAAMSSAAVRGGLLFFGSAGCVSCHDGPSLSSDGFYAQGLGHMEGDGVLGPGATGYERLGRQSITQLAADARKFRTPQLYNLADQAGLGHGGSISSVQAFVAYMMGGVSQDPSVAIEAVSLLDVERDDLAAFLEFGLEDPELVRYLPLSGDRLRCRDGL